MKIMVTGATGFIGSFVVKELVERGDQVFAFDLRPPIHELSKIQEKMTWIQSDARDLGEVEKAVSTHRPEVIVNMAGLLQFGCNENPRQAVELNILGLSNVLEAARKYGVRRVVTASSSAVYGPLKTDVRESASIPMNVTLYGATKFFGEILCRQYIQNYKLEAVNLRYYGVYGPGEVRSPGMAKMLMDIQSIVTGKDVTIPKVKGSDHTHLVFVADAARATVLAATVPGPLNLTYNIAGGPEDFVSFEKMVAIIKKIEPKSGKVTFEGKGEAIGLNPFDISLARKELGFEPRYSLEQGFGESVAYFKRTQRG
ncbi:MAG: NAD(P)-dependent oxidoreductase [Deltaproteobacteria bacterium]|nr:NAD(P)-dependent oxidoreductase [Deltaproteobacteria bacterium]